MWKKYYDETIEERKERQRLTEQNIEKKVAIAVDKKSTETVKVAVAAAKEEMPASYGVLIPAIVNWSRKNPKKIQ